jgi:hypothetical protein
MMMRHHTNFDGAVMAQITVRLRKKMAHLLCAITVFPTAHRWRNSARGRWS